MTKENFEPYYAVIFTNTLKDESDSSYLEMAEKMERLAEKQEGFLGIDSVRRELGITVSYWKNLEAIRIWKANSDHLMAQQLGKSKWYKNYTVRIAKVEREYSFN